MSKERIPCALLINDIHVSKDNIPEFQKNWDEALAICNEQEIPEIIVGGDLWQSRSAQTLERLWQSDRLSSRPPHRVSN